MFEHITVAKRRQILQAAAEVFAVKGFYGAKIEDIAQAAHIGKGTVYEYFRSKEQLFAELIKEGVGHFEKMLDEEIRQASTAREKLICLIRIRIKFAQRYRVLAKMFMHDVVPLDEAFRNWMQQLHTRHLKTIEEIINSGIDSKEIRPLNAGTFTLMFYGATAMLGSPVDQEYAEGEAETKAAEIMDYYFTGLAQGG